MKRKVKKYAGGTLVDSSGNPVRSSSGEPVRTRYGKDDDDRPKAGADDYATMGKRAGATSTWSGEDMSPRLRASKEEAEEAPTGIASGFKSGESKFERNDNEVKMPSIKKKPKPRYSGVVSSEDMGSQDFSSKTKPKPSGDSGLSKATLAAGLGIAGAAGAGALAARRQMKLGTRGEKIEPTMGGTRSPVRNISTEEAAWEGEGGRSYKKGGKTKKMASGGNVSSASSRGDGIAQRGKTKGRIC